MPRQKIHIESRKKDRARIDVIGIMKKIIAEEFSNNAAVTLIAVGGPGGTGKSTFCYHLAQQLEEMVVLRLDDYKTPRSTRQSLNIFGAHPKANEMELITNHLQRLKLGESIEKPLYNPRTGKADTAEFFRPRKYVLLDGEISTYRDFAPYIDFSIFIDSDWRTQLSTRLNRDIRERNYDKDKAIATFLHSNIREFEEFGASSKNISDIHLYCESDYRITLESMSEELFNRHNPLFDGLCTRVGLKNFVLAITTPFTAEGKIDFEAFVYHLQYLYKNGVHRILIAGQTGEFAQLSMQERRDLLATACRYFPGYILYNISELSLQSSLRQIELAEDLGADGVVALPPLCPCNLSEEKIITYYQKLQQKARLADLPLVIYNNPCCSCNPVTENILHALPELYLKDSARHTELAGKSDKYFCGEDRRIEQSLLEEGGLGFISGGANGRPELYVRLEKAFIDRDKEGVYAAQAEIGKYIAGLQHKNCDFSQALKEEVQQYLPDYPLYER